MHQKETVRELIRRRATELLEEGKQVSDIAYYLGTTPHSVAHWRNLVEAGESLNPQPVGGRPRRISDEELSKLEGLLLQGATAHGWHNDLWTTQRIRELTQRELGISYSHTHTWYILRNYLGWTSKKPITRYGERDEKKIEKWPKTTFRQIVAEARNSGWYMVFADEAGFMLMPTLRRTFSPRGTPAIVKTADPHGRISTACAITLSPYNQRANLYAQMLPDNENYNGTRIARFISQLADQLNGPFVLIWDCIPIHLGRPVKALLRIDKRIHLRTFPKYAPELNPADKVWAYLKYSRLANYTPSNLKQLRQTLMDEILLIKKNPKLIHSFVKAPGLDPH